MDQISHIAAVYRRLGSIKATAVETGVCYGSVRKALITAGLYSTDLSVRIEALKDRGLTQKEIAEKLNISGSTVNAHSPYEKCVYKIDDATANAIRIRNMRERRKKEDS